MKEHVNFYEDLPEAIKRLESTVVKYDGDFYYVLCVTDHKNDGIFRIYLDPLKNLWIRSHDDAPYGGYNSNRGELMDQYLEDKPDCPIIRKHLNSPLFDRFRPFPLDMVNYLGDTYYTERSPVRLTQQGLTDQMISSCVLSLRDDIRDYGLDIYNPGFYSTLMGEYPSFEECCAALGNPEISNKSVAFNRTFALFRGPINTLFLFHKAEVVGLLPNGDGSSLILSREHTHLKELINDLNIFQSIKGQE